jgi:hypothetical protein
MKHPVFSLRSMVYSLRSMVSPPQSTVYSLQSLSPYLAICLPAYLPPKP